jgi:RES domain-containing protein
MTVYRMTLAKYATQLRAPGTAARWNSQGRYVIYTAGSVALACLENLVHRDSAVLQSPFKLLTIDIPDTVSLRSIEEQQLNGNWWAQEFSYTKQTGDKWLQQMESCVLKVPSAIIHKEYNFLINPAHAEFNQVRLIATEDFCFDRRLKT